MNELSTKISKLDLDFILDNCFKPALWDKVWTIFAYDEYKITFEITTINTKSKNVSYTLSLYNKDRSYRASSTSGTINFQKEHRNLVVIQKGINGNILRWLIEWHERDFIRKTNAYLQAKDYEDNIEELAEEKAKTLLDELNITNSDIREAYIESQKDKHSTSQYTTNVFNLYKGTKLTKLFLAYTLFSGDKENYDAYKKIARANGFKIGDLRKEIKSELDKIESGEMYEELEMDKI